MKDRLVTLLLAAAAFSLFYVFFIPKPAPAAAELELPLSTERGSDGYQALWRWMNGQGIRVFALRNPYSSLVRAADPLPASGNLLITTMPHRLAARPDELKDLSTWVGRGNTLLIMAALDDTPRWALIGDQSFIRTLERMSQQHFAVPGMPADKRADRTDGRAKRSKAETIAAGLRKALEAEQTVIVPEGEHPLLHDVHSVLASSEFPASHWEPKTLDGSAVIELGQRTVAAEDGGTLKPAIWLKPEGRGQILVSSFASLFSNRMLAERDNARLLSNIVAWSGAPQGFVIFDDDHQGAVSYYDAKAFFHDPRLHRTLLWLVLLWLVFVLGAQRMRASASVWKPADVTQFIGVTAGFFYSALTPAAAGAELFENFLRRIPSGGGSRGDAESAWTWLSQRGASVAQLAELRKLHDKIRTGRPVDLIRLQNILSQLKGTFK